MIKFKLFFYIIFTVYLTSCVTKGQRDNTTLTNSIILETDIGNDVDDALALDMLYKYLDAKKINLLGIMINKEGNFPAEYVDIMNTWYGYSEIPIGIIHNGADCETDAINYAKAVCLLQKNDSTAVFKRFYKNSYATLPEAHLLYRKLLAQQPDKSVTIVSIGFSTNLARLLDTPADEFSPLTGKQLVEQKVKLLCTMAGCFNNPNLYEYNVVKDIKAAQKVFEEWPSTLITSPFEVGIAIEYPGSSIENDFAWTDYHPMVEAYKSYQKMPYNRPTWDLTSVLYAVEGPSHFTLSPAGKITVNGNGATTFISDSTSNRYYLKVDSIQAEKIKTHFVNIISQKPACKSK